MGKDLPKVVEGILVRRPRRRRAAEHPLVTLLGRLGLAGYGVVNLLLAYLTVKVAFGAPESEAEAGKGGALRHLAENPGGTALLWAIASACSRWREQLAEAVRSGRKGGSAGWPVPVERWRSWCSV